MRFTVAVVVTICFLQFVKLDEQQQNDLKTLFGKPPPVRPTAAITHHEPGLPPGWTKPPPNKPQNWWFDPFNLFTSRNTTRLQTAGIEESVNETVVESQVISVITSGSTSTEVNNDTQHPGISPPEPVIVDSNDPNKNVVDWFLGLFGGGNKPGGNKPESSKPQPQTQPTRCSNSCACGVKYKHNRIVGGIETQVNEYPWMAFLTYNGRFYCGASVINDRYLLTACHCVSGFQRERLGATFLDHDRSSPYETKTFTRKIAAVLKHGSYNTGGSYNNDIALLKLDEKLQFNGVLVPICLPPTGKSFTGYKAVVVGWGATESHGQVSNKLREVDVPVMSNIDCKKTGYGSRITDNMLCAGYAQGMKDSCQGDSGGPLHVLDGSVCTIIGVVSWGDGCAVPNYPGVYTRVNRYISWIRSNTKDACYC